MIDLALDRSKRIGVTLAQNWIFEDQWARDHLASANDETKTAYAYRRLEERNYRARRPLSWAEYTEEMRCNGV